MCICQLYFNPNAPIVVSNKELLRWGLQGGTFVVVSFQLCFEIRMNEFEAS
jgi:hypothetical protein